MPPVDRAICERCRAEVTSKALFCPMCGAPRATQAGDPLIGTVIGERYLLQERIGQGGSGTIYRADHISLHRKVAVKILHHELSRDDLAVERFRREATTVSEIDNEHIVEVLDFGRTPEGRPFLAMELLDGETLQTAINRQKQLPIDETLDVLTQVGEALIEAHAMGYVHRDLRPGNIFLAKRRGKRFVKVLDFGLAKLVEAEGEAATTTLGMTFGDPCYMSPEQARGEPIDRRADIYALGIMTYEMLTGRPPFVGKKVFDVLTQHIEVKPPVPSTLRADVPHWLDALVMRSLGKRPGDRFATVYRVIEAIREGQSTGTVMSDAAAKSMPAMEPPPPAPRPPKPPSEAPPAAAKASPPPAPPPAAPTEEVDEVDEVEPAAVASSPIAQPAPSPSRRVAMPSLSEGSQSWFDEGDDLTDQVVVGSTDHLEVSAIRSRSRGRRPLLVAAGVVLLGAAGLGAYLWLREPPPTEVAANPTPPPDPTPNPTPTPIQNPTPNQNPNPNPPPDQNPTATATPTQTPPPNATQSATPTPTPDPPTAATPTPPPKPARKPTPAKAAAARPATKPRSPDAAAPAAPAPAAAKADDSPKPPVIDFRKAAAAEAKDKGTQAPPAAAEPSPPNAITATPEPTPTPTASPQPAGLRPPPADRDPVQAEFYVKMGQRALRDGDDDAAQENFTKARSFDNTNADAIAGLGAVALREGKSREATIHLDAAARLAPNSARIQVLRGQAYLALGKRDEAAAAFKKALSLAPDDAAAAKGYKDATAE